MTREKDKHPLAFVAGMPGLLLLLFLGVLLVLNFGRWDEWGADGFRVYLTQAIMQTTLIDFGLVLLIMTWFLHRDARRHGLTYWWVLPTYPFLPGAGLLLYFVVRRRKLATS